ncbi:EamA family transporter [Nautilia sp.]
MKIYILLILCVLFWSGNFVIGRYIHNDISPIELAFYRWGGVFAVILPVFIGHFKKMGLLEIPCQSR